jgi:hypothetical protein
MLPIGCDLVGCGQEHCYRTRIIAGSGALAHGRHEQTTPECQRQHDEANYARTPQGQANTVRPLTPCPSEGH